MLQAAKATLGERIWESLGPNSLLTANFHLNYLHLLVYNAILILF